MLEKLGFRHIGAMKEVGAKFGKLMDVCLLQKMLQGTLRTSMRPSFASQCMFSRNERLCLSSVLKI